jgi:hypothetical protein
MVNNLCFLNRIECAYHADGMPGKQPAIPTESHNNTTTESVTKMSSRLPNLDNVQNDIPFATSPSMTPRIVITMPVVAVRPIC